MRTIHGNHENINGGGRKVLDHALTQWTGVLSRQPGANAVGMETVIRRMCAVLRGSCRGFIIMVVTTTATAAAASTTTALRRITG